MLHCKRGVGGGCRCKKGQTQRPACTRSIMNNDESTLVLDGTNNADIQLQEIACNELKNQHEDSDQSSVRSPQDGKVYYFGCGSCHPRWLQCLADGKFYTFILSLFVIVEGAIISGKKYNLQARPGYYY